MRQNLIAFFIGMLFAAGLAISGMTNPAKVLAFLDVSGGRWDPSLAFVMLGAVAFNIFSFRWILRRQAPVYGVEFSLPEKQGIDKRLLLGALLFGIGWGLVGFCPGPAIANLVSGHSSVWIFVAAMVIGMLLYRD